MVNPAEVPLVSMRLSIKTDLRRMSVAVALSAGPLSAGTTEERDPENGLLSWTWREQGVSIQLVQRLPDQTRAFFLGRGFQLADADLVAKSCVFAHVCKKMETRRNTLIFLESSWPFHL